MRKFLLSVMIGVTIFLNAGCSTGKITEFSTAYSYKGEKIEAITEIHYEIFLEGNEDELEQLSVKEVTYSDELKPLILESTIPEGKTIISKDIMYYVISGNINLNTEGMTKTEVNKLAKVSSVTVENGENQIEINLR